MLGEKDVSILGRLKDKVNNTSFPEFKNYMQEKLEYTEKEINRVKSKTERQTQKEK